MKYVFIVMIVLGISLVPSVFADTIPQSLHGYETSGGEYSQIWIEFEDLEIKSVKFSLPDISTEEWIPPLVYDLPNPKYSTDDNTFTILSSLSPKVMAMFSGKYLDENTVLIDGRISFHDEKSRRSISDMNIMKLQYIANVTNKEIDVPPQQITILGKYQDVVFFRIGEYNIQLNTVDADNHLVKIGGVKISYTVTRDGVILDSGGGYTTRLGVFNDSVTINTSKFLPNACYHLNITAAKDGQVTEITEDFSVMTYSTTYGQTIDRDGSSLLIPSDYNCNG